MGRLFPLLVLLALLAGGARHAHAQDSARGAMRPIEVSNGFPGPSAEVLVRWHEVSVPDLYRICSGQDWLPDRPALNGCYVRSGGTCHIYTLPLAVWEARGNPEHYHSTAGHELRHCRDGWFHGAPRGVRLPHDGGAKLAFRFR